MRAPRRFLAVMAMHVAHAFVCTQPRAPPLVARRAYADSIFPSTASDVFVGNLPRARGVLSDCYGPYRSLREKKSSKTAATGSERG